VSGERNVIKPKRKVRKKPESPELLYYGEHICQKLSERRRSDVIRVYCTDELLPKFKDLLQWCTSHRKAYHVVSAKELERISGSVHHEGVAILAKQRLHGNLDDLKQAVKGKPDIPLLYLDGVQNPHNIGTIMRVMASFGWPYAVGPKGLAPISSAGARMSEGGAEFVEVFAVETAAAFFAWAKENGYAIFGTSSHKSQSLFETRLPRKSIFVLGHEVHGISHQTQKIIDLRLAIPATGQVESLNVAVAAGIVIAEFTRQHTLITL
jgi:TrmH RNA methyltransferase